MTIVSSVHVAVHGEYVVGGCNVVAIEHGRYILSCMQNCGKMAQDVGMVLSFPSCLAGF